MTRDEYDMAELDYRKCHVALVDALRNYIRCNIEMRRDWLAAGKITLEKAAKGQAHIDRFQAVLDEIEHHEFDPTLCGIIKRIPNT